MTKTELVKAIAAKAEISNAQGAKALDAFIEAVTGALKGGDKVSLVGFGTFEVKDVPAKEGINPATGAKIKIPASKRPAFVASKALKDAING